MKLTTGKELYANGNVFGLTPDGRLTEGYDSIFYMDEDNDDELLTPAEKSEIAEEMINRWKAFKENLRA